MHRHLVLKTVVMLDCLIEEEERMWHELIESYVKVVVAGACLL
jgi:hypothetical protein